MSTTAEAHWEQMAFGRSGDTEICVDRTVTDPCQWTMTIETSTWSLRFAIAGHSIAAAFSDFLAAYQDRKEHHELVIGRFQNAEVRIVKDDEFADRFFLVTAGGDDTMFISLGANSVTEMYGALAKVVADLSDSDNTGPKASMERFPPLPRTRGRGQGEGPGGKLRHWQ